MLDVNGKHPFARKCLLMDALSNGLIDVDAILNLPISFRLSKFWAHTRSGVYSVKISYHVAQQMCQLVIEGTSSSMLLDSLWKSI